MENNKNPQDYFVTDIENQNYEEKSLQEKMQPVQDTAKKGLIKIWPTLIRALNSILYYTFKIIRGAINIALSQLK